MGNKTLTLTLFSLVFATSASASDVISSAQLGKYEDALKYLDCKYASNQNCGSSFANTDEARDAVSKYKDMTAVGMNASNKNKLDKESEELLPKISMDELKDYSKYLATLSQADLMDEALPSYVLSTTLSMPSVEMMESMGNQAAMKNISSKSETMKQTYSKDQVLAMISQSAAEDAADNALNSPTPYLAKINSDVKLYDNKLFELTNDSVVGIIKMETAYEDRAAAVANKVLVTNKVKRDPASNYDIKVFATDIENTSEYDEALANAEPETVVLDFAGDIKDRTVDEQWMNRYNDIKDQDRNQREQMGMTTIVDLSARTALKAYEKAYDIERAIRVANLPQEKINELSPALTGYAKSLGIQNIKRNPSVYEKKVQEQLEKAKKALADGRSPANEVRTYNTDASKQTYKLYNSVSSFNYDSAKEQRYEEEMQVNRGVVSFNVYF